MYAELTIYMNDGRPALSLLKQIEGGLCGSQPSHWLSAEPWLVDMVSVEASAPGLYTDGREFPFAFNLSVRATIQGADQSVSRIWPARCHLLNVLDENLHIDASTVVEQELLLHSGKMPINQKMVYADWLEERQAYRRAGELREQIRKEESGPK